jgi:predicted RNase H-like nuclease (RuvC/YqgF family)
MVDLSSELVEKDLQIEQMSNRTQELEQQVEIRDNTIEVLENQLHDVQEELGQRSSRNAPPGHEPSNGGRPKQRGGGGGSRGD